MSVCSGDPMAFMTKFSNAFRVLVIEGWGECLIRKKRFIRLCLVL